MRLKISWASLTIGSKFIVLALLYFVFEGNFPSTSPQEAYIWRGDLTGFFFFALPVWGLIHGGDYFRNFTVFCIVYQGVFGHFIQKISDGYRRFLKIVEDFRILAKRSDHCPRCPKYPPNT